MRGGRNLLARFRRQPELALHKQVADYLALALPTDAVTSCVPSGGGGRARGAKLKAMGLKAGLPDLLIFWASQSFGVELKREGEDAEPHQRAMHELLRRAGCRCAVVHNLDELELCLKGWGIPLRFYLSDERRVAAARRAA